MNAVRPPDDAIPYDRAVYRAVLERMRRRLPISGRSGKGAAPLEDLNTWVDDDWSMALLHAGAALVDVLSFYQERIINEGYLRTAREERSLFELGRAVGHEPSPGQGANAHLAFTVLTVDGEPPRHPVVPKGAAVQSVPRREGELPQTFETEHALIARSEWNALKAGASGQRNLTLRCDAGEVRLDGINIGVQPGAQLLIVADPEGDPRPWPRPVPWLTATVTSVAPDPDKGFTRVAWDVDDQPRSGYYTAPGTPPPAAAAPELLRNPRLFLLQAPAAPFAYTAGGVYGLAENLSPPRWLPMSIGLPKTLVRQIVRNRRGALFAATAKDVYRSTDRANTWRPVPVSPALKDITALLALDDDSVLAATADGAVYLTKDDGITWTAQSGDAVVPAVRGIPARLRTSAAPLPKTVVRSLSATGGGEVVAATDAGVFVSADRGRNWEARNGDLPDVNAETGLSATPVRATVAAPGGDIYAATGAGVFRLRPLPGLRPLVGIAIALLALLVIVGLLLPKLPDSQDWLSQATALLPKLLQLPWLIATAAALLLALAALVLLARQAAFRFLPARAVVWGTAHSLALGPDRRPYALVTPGPPPPGALAGLLAKVKPPKPPVELPKLAPGAPSAAAADGAGAAKEPPPAVLYAGPAPEERGRSRHPVAALRRYFGLPEPSWEELKPEGLPGRATLASLAGMPGGELLGQTTTGDLYRLDAAGGAWAPLLPAPTSEQTGAVPPAPARDAAAAQPRPTRTVAVDPALSGSGAGLADALGRPLAAFVSAAPGAGNHPSLVNPAGSGDSAPRELLSRPPLKAIATLCRLGPPDAPLLAVGEPDAPKLESRWAPEHLRERWLDLDKIYPGIQAGQWVVLRQRGQPPAALALVTAAGIADSVDAVRPDRLTRLTLENARGTEEFDRQTTVAMAQGVELKFFDDSPVEGKQLALNRFVPDLFAGQVLIVSGKRMRARRRAGDARLQAEDGRELDVLVGESLEVMRKFVKTEKGLEWTLRHHSGVVGTVRAQPNDFILEAAQTEDETAAERVTIASVNNTPNRTELSFNEELTHYYDRTTVIVYGNVVHATQGETVESEQLGSSAGMAAFQSFTLAESPLTYLPSGPDRVSRSTLQVAVNGLAWEEVEALYGLPRHRRAYMLRRDLDGRTRIIFGDGRSGAGLARGTSNIEARYRRGAGSAGNIPAGSLTLLQSSLTDIKEVTNPIAASGGADPSSAAEAREVAPRLVRTLNRVVSLSDLADCAVSLPGVTKARARVISSARPYYLLTVARKEDDFSKSELEELKRQIDARRPPGQKAELAIVNAERVYFEIVVLLDVHAGLREPGEPQKRFRELCRGALIDRFAFERRDLDQPVADSEVVAALHDLPGMIAVLDVALVLTKEEMPAAGAPRADAPGRLALILPTHDAITLNLKDAK